MTRKKEPTMSDTVTINGVEYLPADALKGVDRGPTERRIVIAQRGWVFVGLWNQDGDDITLTDASVIRVWGTTNGLGELRHGPLSDTKLDPAGTVRLHRLAVVATLDVEGGSW